MFRVSQAVPVGAKPAEPPADPHRGEAVPVLSVPEGVHHQLGAVPALQEELGVPGGGGSGGNIPTERTAEDRGGQETAESGQRLQELHHTGRGTSMMVLRIY